MKNNPETRFQEFSEAWNTALIEDCFIERKERSGDGEMISVTINTGIRKAKELDRTVHIGDTSNYKVVRQGDIAYNSMRMWQGASGYSPYDGILSPAYTVIIPKQDIISEFFASLFKQPELIHTFELNSQGLTSDTWNLKFEKLKKITISYPSSPEEQHKIAQFFSRLDSLITAEDKKLERLKTIKTASLEKMFPKHGETVPEVRFKGFTKVWEEHNLSELSDKVTEKNIKNAIREVFTNSAEYGIVSQRDFFNHDIANEKNIDGYYVVEPNDFVYNPRMSVTAPVGPINRNKLNRKGVMSPLYYIFRTHDVYAQYLEYYFKTKHWYSFMYYNGDNGARGDRFSIKNDVFVKMPIPVPQDEKEQIYIAEFFSRLDSLISAQEQKIGKLRSLKKSFLEKMFVSTPK